MASPDAKEATRKFVPGIQNLYGIRMPLLNTLATELKKDASPAFVQALWASGAYEEKILAAKLIGKFAKKDPDSALQMVEAFSGGIQDWAVCDTLGLQSLKPIIATHRRQIFSLAARLNLAKNPWQRRLSLVVVEPYTKDPALHPEISKLLEDLGNDREYYVKKAVAWLQRNMEK